MSAEWRIPKGGRIDRGHRLGFSFDGKNYHGYAGDTLASALLANGVHLVGRSFKYHRPRGILTAGSDEPNALVTISRDDARVTPNLRATTVELYEGLRAESQNRSPALAFDVGAMNDRLSAFFPAGFYYKTFMWPKGAWKRFYEPKIRAMAGLGRAPRLADPDRYLNRYAHCDVLVIGSGPAGLAAALTAASTGGRVILCDEQAELGGSLLADREASIDGLSATAWRDTALASLASVERVTLLPRTTAFGYFLDNMVGLVERVTDHLADPDPSLPRERLWQVRAKEVVLAQGAIERPLIFPGNDRPGIMLANAARTYLTRYGVKCGSRAVVVTAHDAAYGAALTLHRAGIEIAAIADLRSDACPAAEQARAAGIRIEAATSIAATEGHLRIAAVELARVAAGPSGHRERIACDLLLMSGGFTPSVHLFSQSRGELRFDPGLDAFVPGRSAEHERSAGAARGVFGLAEALADGAAAGASAARAAGYESARAPPFAVSAPAFGSGGIVGAASSSAEAEGAKAFVDFQNDVTAHDLMLAMREGFRSIEHVKRYTTTGMATDQGKTSNMNALGIVAATLKKPIPEVGLTTFRSPYTPVTFGALAGLARGELFDPVRTTPIHAWAAEHGAVFQDAGQWKRARYFPGPGEDMAAAVARESLNVRTNVGIFDGSTLGKIEVVGRDAAMFLERVTVNSWTKLGVGRCRYGVVLREDGFIADDGVVGRLAPDRFHVTTTTGGQAHTLAMMEEYRQTEWPELAVWLTSITDQWAVIALQGPRSRAVLAGLVEGIDISREAMPHMSVAEGRIAGIPMRLFRVSYTGEMGFEVNVPADYGRAVWEVLVAKGEPLGLMPYGLETMEVLRAEKGYIAVGQDTDGTTAPGDAGLAWVIGKNKQDFIGKRSLSRPAMRALMRKQLVGLETKDPDVLLDDGAEVLLGEYGTPPIRPLGHVTSSYRSANLHRSIALAMVAGGRSRMGETVYVSTFGHPVAAKVVSPVFYDPEGTHLDVA